MSPVGPTLILLFSNISVAISIVTSSNVPRAINVSIVVIPSVTIVLITLNNTLICTSSNKGPIERLISLPATSTISDVSPPAKSNPPVYISKLLSTPAADNVSVPAKLTVDPSLPVIWNDIESAASFLSTAIEYVVLPPSSKFRSDMSIVCMNVVPVLGTPCVLVKLPPPVICAHPSVPKSPHVDPLGILAGPWPPQSRSMSPSNLVPTKSLSPSRISPESSFVIVVVVVVVVIVSIVVVPVASVSVSITDSSNICTIISGANSPASSAFTRVE